MIRSLIMVSLGLAVAGCSSMGMERFGGGNRASSLPPSPTTPVQSQALGPLVVQPQDGTQVPVVQPNQQPINNALGAEAEIQDQATQIASNNAGAGTIAIAGGGRAISRTDLLGAWTLASGAEQCRLNVNLTNWTGGYRASSRGCQSSNLQRINAWKLVGNQVVLLAEDGATELVRLNSTSPSRFDGQSSSGQAVSVFR